MLVQAVITPSTMSKNHFAIKCPTWQSGNNSNEKTTKMPTYQWIIEKEFTRKANTKLKTL